LRVDLFLKLMGITKTRMAAKRLCDRGNVLSGGKPLKPSHELEGGETLEVLLPFKEMKLKVLEIPSGKSVAKSERNSFLQVESANERSI
jgi:ribosomal 50S subunit-recycling heat shock protein